MRPASTTQVQGQGQDKRARPTSPPPPPPCRAQRGAPSLRPACTWWWRMNAAGGGAVGCSSLPPRSQRNVSPQARPPLSSLLPPTQTQPHTPTPHTQTDRPNMVDDKDIEALFAEVEASPLSSPLPSQATSSTTLPARLCQDGLTGETVLLPPPTSTHPTDPSFFYEHIAATTTPYGLAQPSAAQRLQERYIDIPALIDELVRPTHPPTHPPTSSPPPTPSTPPPPHPIH